MSNSYKQFNVFQEWERRRREAQEDAERRHKRQVDERRERMILRQQQREEDYRRKKAEHFKDPKIAVKVSSGVNFTNILRTNFFLHILFWQLFSSYMYVVIVAKTTFVPKICTFNFDEIDYRVGQFIIFRKRYEMSHLHIKKNFSAFLKNSS
jgi:hypothetical protein